MRTKADEGGEIQQQRNFQLKEKIRLHTKRFLCYVLHNDDTKARVTSFCVGTQQISIKSGFNKFENKMVTHAGRARQSLDAKCCFKTINTNL